MKLSLTLVAFASLSSTLGVSGNNILPAEKKSSCLESRFACPWGSNVDAHAHFGTSSSSITSRSSSSASPSLVTALSVRGGEVLEPTTLSQVEDILMKASAEGKLVVIDFSATWCGPCRAIAPLYKELSEQIPNVVFLKVDVDENQETAAKYEVTAMPTFLFIKRGEIVDKMMGANPAKLQELLEELA